MNISANRMDRGFEKHQKEYEAAALKVLRSGWYVLGEEVKSFEEEFASFVGAKYCAGLASGLDALWIGGKLLGIGSGDEVIIHANAYIASVMGITINGATPVFVEPDETYQINVDEIEKKITSKTKAVMTVHLYGNMADMGRVRDICDKHHLMLIEDCAQAHGASWNGRNAGTWGDIACFSFYPTKNLGAFGDAGAIVSNNKGIIDNAKIFRNYGSEKHYYNKVVGANSRLDEIQAAMLRVRLKYMDEITAERKRLALRYTDEIHNSRLILPLIKEHAGPVWHQYVVRVASGNAGDRDDFMAYLKDNGIGSTIHYPVPPHLSEAYSYLGMHRGDLPVTEKYADSVLSLPMYSGMTDEEQVYVIKYINDWK